MDINVPPGRTLKQQLAAGPAILGPGRRCTVNWQGNRAARRGCTVSWVGTGPAISWAGDRAGPGDGLGHRLGDRAGLGERVQVF